MGRRFWFYLAALIIMAGEVSTYAGLRSRQANLNAIAKRQALEQRTNEIKSYLAKQKDERKLVSLAKRLRHTDSATLQLILDRAYQLNPNSRDIALLDSQFHPELKARVLELDPLYGSVQE